MQNYTPQKNHLKKIVIVGGGTAGWMAAAAFSKMLTDKNLEIVLVESEQIGTVGVGEATIPQILTYNHILGIDENEFIKATHATFKLGIEFENWGQIGHSYIHPFGAYGTDLNNLQFFQFWQKLYQLGRAPDISHYSLNIKACEQNKFMRPQQIPNSPLSKISYAFHFDASLYAKFLRNFSEQRGVKRIEGLVKNVIQNNETGFIKSVQLDSGEKIDSDFFVDCSGFRGLLIEQTLHTGYEDWSHYLPCDSALAIPSEKMTPLPPYTKATAHEAGWQWRIPLQHRTGNGHVYSSKFIDDDKAEKILRDNLETPAIGDARLIRFTTGKRRKHWNKNVLALGLASGFLEPLESTSIHLINEGIGKFLGLFPTLDYNQAMVDKYNQQMDNAFTFIKDFLICHYCVTKRNDSPFWNYVRTMDIPDSLKVKMELYQSSARLYRDNEELFNETSWLAVLHGQGLKAGSYNSIVDAVPQTDLEEQLKRIEAVIDKCCLAIPSHQDFINEHCKSQMS